MYIYGMHTLGGGVVGGGSDCDRRGESCIAMAMAMAMAVAGLVEGTVLEVLRTRSKYEYTFSRPSSGIFFFSFFFLFFFFGG